MKTKKIIFGIIVSVVLFAFSTTLLPAQETIITKAQLPQSAQTFIYKNFKSQTISYIKKDNEVLSVDYDVVFTNGMEIKFDSKGNWEEVDGEHQAIPTGFISQKITSYISSQFPGTQIVKIEKKKFGQQEVKISNGLELIFNSSEGFVKIDD